MSTPLPVIAGAYNRLASPPEDPYGISNEPDLDAARDCAANAQNMLLRFSSGLTNSGSGTAMSADALFTINQPQANPTKIFVELKSGLAKGLIFAFVTENETNDVIHEAFKQSVEKFSTIFERSCFRAELEGNSAATTLFSAAEYRANLDSTTTKQPIEDRFPWLKQVYELVRLGQTSKALRAIYSAVEDHFKRQDIVGLGEVLAEVDLKRLNPQTMTALLRITGRARRALPIWYSVLERVKAELARLNVPDLSGVLVGLTS